MTGTPATRKRCLWFVTCAPHTLESVCQFGRLGQWKLAGSMLARCPTTETKGNTHDCHIAGGTLDYVTSDLSTLLGRPTTPMSVSVAEALKE